MLSSLLRFLRRYGAGAGLALFLLPSGLNAQEFPAANGHADYHHGPFAPMHYQQAPLHDPQPAAAEGAYRLASHPAEFGPGGAPAVEMRELRQRLENLERQNQELVRRLDAASAPHAPGSTDAESSAAGEQWYEVGSDRKMQASWNNGLELISAHKDFRVHVGGRVQFDTIWLDESPALLTAAGIDDGDSFNFRRARLRVDGTMYDWIDWATEFDFTNTVNINQGQEAASEGNVIVAPAPTDLWVNFKSLPYVGNFRVGNFKEPIGMEHLTSSRFLPFLERSYNQDLFYGPFNNGFSPGAMIWDSYDSQYGTWATGVFKNQSNIFGYGTGDGEYAWTSRMTYLPYYDESSNGRYLMHVGIATSVRDLDNEARRFRAREALRTGPPGPLNPVLIDTGRFLGDTENQLALESALNYGPLNLQAEWVGAFVTDSIGNRGALQDVPLGTTFYQGYYVQALYFLTGEHMQYDRTAGVFTRVLPFENAYLLEDFRHRVVTRGAWQLAIRYSHADLNSDGIEGGMLNNFTVGLNWYFNPNMKLQSNYIFTDRNVPTALGADGDIHGYGMRLAYDF